MFPSRIAVRGVRRTARPVGCQPWKGPPDAWYGHGGRRPGLFGADHARQREPLQDAIAGHTGCGGVPVWSPQFGSLRQGHQQGGLGQGQAAGLATEIGQ